MLHVDPLRHDLRAGQQHFQQTAVRILALIVGVQKHPSFEV